MNKNIILTIIIISLVSIFLTYSLYFVNFHNGFSNQSSDWSNFGSFINSLSPILMFFNILLIIYTVSVQLNELKKQRESLYYPNISLSGIPYVTSTDLEYSFNEIEKFPNHWDIDRNNPTFYCKSDDKFFLKMYNIGMGAAKNISIEWTIDYNSILQTINRKAGLSTYKIENEKIVINRMNTDNLLNKQIEYDINSNYKKHYDFLLQSKETEDYVGISIPKVILDLNSLYFFELRKNEFNLFALKETDMIKVNISINYSDITNSVHKRNFNAIFHIHYAEPIDINNYKTHGEIKIRENC